MPRGNAYQALPSVPWWIGGRANGDRKVPFFSSEMTTASVNNSEVSALTTESAADFSHDIPQRNFLAKWPG